MNLIRGLFGEFGERVLGGAPLDEMLFKWQGKDAFTKRDLLRSVAIIGQTGSGKSSGSGLLLARAIVRMKRSGGLILASKPEDSKFWRERFRETRRINDLILFGPKESARCGFIDFEMKSGGDARSLTDFLMVMSEGLGGRSGGEDPFWKQSQQRLIYNAVEAVRQGMGKVTVPDLQKFITTAAYSTEEFASDAWKKKFHFMTMDAAARRNKTKIEQSDYALVAEYWGNEFAAMDNKPRSSILAGVMNTLHTFNTGIVRELVSTTTTVSPADMGRGKWILVDFPLDVYGDSGRIIMHGWKYLTQKYILRRHAKPSDPVIVIHADEAQEMVSSFDPAFLAKCRSHMGCMIFLTQSFHSYFGDAR